MPYPCRIIPRNVFDLATITASATPATNTALANLKNDRRARICRFSPASSGTYSVYGTWNGTGYAVGGVALDRFNLETNATVRFRGWASIDRTGATLLDSGTVEAYNSEALGEFSWGVDPLGSGIFDGYLGHKYWVYWFTTKGTIGSFQFDFTDTGNSEGFLDVARCVVGDYIETTYNADFGAQSGWKSSTEQEETDGGSLISVARAPRRVLAGNFSTLSHTERQNLFEFTRYVEKRKSFLISLQSGETGALGRDFTIPRAKFVNLPVLSWDQPLSHSMPFDAAEA
jgi:hypothetical protein